MRAVFEPRGWTVNRVDIDYGTDFEVEVFRDLKSTGVTFKVQLKSSESTQYSTDKEFVSQLLDSRSAARLSKELRSPVILIHADCKDGRTFWSAPQLDTRLSETLSTKGNKSITVRIPTSHELPATIDELIRTVTQAEQVLASRLLIATPVIDFIDAIEGRVDENALLQAFKNTSDAVKLMKAQELLVTGSLSEARTAMQKVFDDSESSIESKFWAVLWLERVEFIELVKANAPQELWSRADLNTSIQLQNLAKRGPSHLKFFALISLRAAELHRLVHRDYGLYLNWRLHEKSTDPLWTAQLAFERADSFRCI